MMVTITLQLLRSPEHVFMIFANEYIVLIMSPTQSLLRAKKSIPSRIDTLRTMHSGSPSWLKNSVLVGTSREDPNPFLNVNFASPIPLDRHQGNDVPQR